ncbi:addiction module antitoxin [Alcanivorax sp. 521-1]|uniref:Addiction module antitoxin n=1 Tax=Alloalcanivorax profundimaris TaxID=2735259 RepID=A0ABS0ATZ7_9GAMM|nr:type II toxin-antitoxin system RelE/ParE family toxin [Alloalcanivorax profundimaris]MAO58135.1 type II toxin-antitoxin system mRNA interferase toxin, RelE/StbE family [Alcanivorax sp.]MAY09971.1 type II toxin-antitoxin system mRNA interferase toxin, RelE/StbE family [Alcanivorax sp.]MBF5057602.1 addiction module antitoxin [Alloalcanivorax profundimaris]MBU57280.1 type II toxin-antitoxin system mRNA interferase toxin, RelE/StbE family [Alcanivorax sp.]HCE41705.1 type II toxin-antitoxin syst|tara:strand:- start:212 stop:520 length:309 start_codon:yes stop_codon:yes gene_type:complete
MVYQVNWSPAARDDLRGIADYIAADSLFYAEAVVNKIIDVSDSLGEYPNRGRIVPDWGLPDFRERFVYSYRLIYRVSDDEVVILAVVHGRRLLEGIEDEPGE